MEESSASTSAINSHYISITHEVENDLASEIGTVPFGQIGFPIGSKFGPLGPIEFALGTTNWLSNRFVYKKSSNPTK